MKDVALNRIEKKCLYAIKRYPNADIGISELNGYLHFPALEVILGAIGKLKTNGLIEDKEAPFHGFQLSGTGREYIRRHRLIYLLAPRVEQVVSGTIAGIAAGIILYYLGVS